MDIFENYTDYQESLTESVKKSMYSLNPQIFEHFDFYENSLYQEPLVFASLHNNFNYWINLIGLRYRTKNSTPPVILNDFLEYKIFIPRFGYVDVAKDKEEKALRVKDNETIFLCEDGSALKYQISRTPIFCYPGIECIVSQQPLLESFFRNEQGQQQKVHISKTIYDEHSSSLKNAFKIIEKVNPRFYDMVLEHIKNIVLFEGPVNSFATIMAHGAIFISVRDDNGVAFFLEDITHQAAHVFFNTLTFEKEGLFLIPHTTKFSDITMDKSDEKATVYDRFHGLYTHLHINNVLTKVIESSLCNTHIKTEIMGRLCVNMNRFEIAIKKFEKANVLAPQGSKWFNVFLENFKTSKQKCQHILDEYDVSNQPYIFDYSLFLNTNSITNVQ